MTHTFVFKAHGVDTRIGRKQKGCEDLAVRIIIGGTPNSSKSTLTVRLGRALQDLGVDAKTFDLDPFAPTLEMIIGNITKQERDALKSKAVTKDRWERIARQFEDVSTRRYVVIGDAPGRYTKDLDLLLGHGTHGIILVREGESDQTKEWTEAFVKNGIKIVAVISSTLAGEEKLWVEGGLIKGVMKGLNRTGDVTPITRHLASLLISALTQLGQFFCTFLHVLNAVSRGIETQNNRETELFACISEPLSGFVNVP